MKLRTGLVAGAAVGYYLGAKAGRQRYEQMSRVVQRAGRSGALRTGVAKAKAVVDLGAERVRDLVSHDPGVEALPGIPVIGSRRNRRAGRHRTTGTGNGYAAPVVRLGEAWSHSPGERRYY